MDQNTEIAIEMALLAAIKVAVQQKRHHHPRVKRRLPETAHIAARDLLEIKALPHQLNDKPRDMAFRHEVLHIRRQQQRLIDIPGAKILAHGPRLNQTRSELNSDYSDRLLARFAKAAGAGEMLNIHDLKAAYEKAIGHDTSNSTVYNLLARHGWRKLMPRPFHPKRDIAAQNSFKTNGFLMR